MSIAKKPLTLPTIHHRKVVAKSRLFAIEQIDLEFSNGEQREYERMVGSGRGAIMVVPVTASDDILLVEEYAAGTHSYQLGFPKGLIDPGETPEQAANRELQEEIGYAAQQLTLLHTVNMAPGFFNAPMHIFMAENLYPSCLPGDEPEPLHQVSWPIVSSSDLLLQDNFSEARSVCALLLFQQHRRTTK